MVEIIGGMTTPGVRRISLRELTRLAALHGSMSEQSQQALALLASVDERLGDPLVRAELRSYLDECERGGVNLTHVEQARIVLAAFEGELCASGDVEEGVLVVDRGDERGPVAVAPKAAAAQAQPPARLVAANRKRST